MQLTGEPLQHHIWLGKNRRNIQKRDGGRRCARVERDSKNTVFLDLAMLFVEVIHRGAGSDNFHFFTHKVH